MKDIVLLLLHSHYLFSCICVIRNSRAFFLFFFFLIHSTTASVLQYLVTRIIWMLMNNEMDRMWQQEVVAYFKTLFRRLYQGAVENHKCQSEQPVFRPRLQPGTARRICQNARSVSFIVTASTNMHSNNNNTATSTPPNVMV